MINNKYIKLLMENNDIVEGEKFEVILEDGRMDNDNPYVFENDMLYDKYNNEYEEGLGDLFLGNFKIEKLPFVPKGNEGFWFIYLYVKEGYDFDYADSEDGKMLLSRGVTPYRTKAEVIAKVKELGW